MTRSRTSQADASRYLAGIGTILLFGFVAFSPSVLTAQSPAPADSPVQVGDRWTYDTKDEITGSPSDTYTHLVTEISPKEIVVRVATGGKTGTGLVVFDHEWNRLENAVTKWKPNDGSGVRLPLAVGKQWRSEIEARNTQTGSASKTTVVSKIVAEEMVTTSAGTFSAFKIESLRHEISASDASKSWEYQEVVWYAPQINHWVRRTFMARTQKRLTASTSEELIEFARKP